MCPYHYMAYFSVMIWRGIERRRRGRGEFDVASRLAVSRVVQCAACCGLGRREVMQSFLFNKEDLGPVMEGFPELQSAITSVSPWMGGMPLDLLYLKLLKV